MNPILPFPIPGTDVSQRGQFWSELRDPDGSLVDRWPTFNGAVFNGLNYMQAAAFKGGPQYSNWYIGLLDSAGYTGISNADTMAAHTGWVEFASYSASARPAWLTPAPASGVLASNAATVFTFTATGTLRGMFLCSDATKSGTAGILWATALETTPRAVANLQTLNVFYSNTLAPVS